MAHSQSSPFSSPVAIFSWLLGVAIFCGVLAFLWMIIGPLATPAVVMQVAYSAGLFLLLYLVVGRGYFRHIFKVLEERELRTEGSAGTARDRLEEVAAVRQKIDSELRAARFSGAEARDAVVDEAKRSAEQKIQTAQDAARKELEAARETIAGQTAAAMEEVDAEAAKLADVVLGRVLDSNNAPTVH